MDFKGLDQKISEDEYIQLYEDAGWNLVGRLGGWYYFSQESSEDIDLLIFNDNASKALIYQRILAFLLLVGFPMYYQIIFVFPSLSSTSLAFPSFYFFFRICNNSLVYFIIISWELMYLPYCTSINIIRFTVLELFTVIHRTPFSWHTGIN